MTTWRGVMRVAVRVLLKETPDMSMLAAQPLSMAEFPLRLYFLKIFGEAPGAGKVGAA